MTANVSIFNFSDEMTTDNYLFRNATDFSYYIQTTAKKEGMTCTQTILEYCEQRDLDPEDIAKLINRALKEQITLEMQEDGLLPKNSTLEFE
jgi:hypothetical protein